jgi:low affinity Fe/Cu permease
MLRQAPLFVIATLTIVVSTISSKAKYCRYCNDNRLKPYSTKSCLYVNTIYFICTSTSIHLDVIILFSQYPRWQFNVMLILR